MLSLCCLVAAVVSSEVFYFKGGTDYDLARAVADHVGAPSAVLSAASKGVWPLIRVEYKEKKDLISGLRGKLQLDTLSTDVCGLASREWPEQFYFIGGRPARAASYNDAKPVITWSGEKVTIRTPSGPVRLSRLLNQFRPPVSAHWFYGDEWIACEIKGASQTDALAVIARAAGAKLEQNGSKTFLGFDSSAYRRRASELLSRLSVSSPTSNFRPSYRFTREVINWLDDKQLAMCLQDPSAGEEFEAAKVASIQTVAAERLKVFYPVRGGDEKYPASALKTWRTIKEWADYDVAYKVGFEASGWATAVYKGRTKEHGDAHI